MLSENELYEVNLKKVLENLLQFFALSVEQQLSYLPDSMPAQFYDQHDMISETNRPLEAILYNLKEHCRKCSLRAGFEGFEHIDEAICNEVFALCEILIFYWQNNTIDIEVEILNNGVTWRKLTLKEHYIWGLLRRIARIALEKNGWVVKSPEMKWDELAIF